MTGSKKLLLVSVAILALVLAILRPAWTGEAIPYDRPSQSLGTIRNPMYLVQYLSKFEKYTFKTPQEASAFASARGNNPSAEVIPPGKYPNVSGSKAEVYVGYWMGAQERDPHKAFVQFIDLKARYRDVRVLLTFERPASYEEQNFSELFDRTVFGTTKWIPQWVTLRELPAQFQQTETGQTTVRGNWTLTREGQLLGQWEDGSGGWLQLEQWDPTQVVFTRRDNGGPKDGLTARYVGSWDWYTLKGNVTWKWRGRPSSGKWSASPGSWNLAQQQVTKSCTRGEGVLTAKGSAISVSGNTLSYTDPQSRVTNSIQWNPPPQPISPDQEITLTSWSSHNPGAPVEVHWETSGFRDYGADSMINESVKQSKFKYNGGPVKLIGGIRGSSVGGPGKFEMQWNYTCQ